MIVRLKQLTAKTNALPASAGFGDMGCRTNNRHSLLYGTVNSERLLNRLGLRL